MFAGLTVCAVVLIGAKPVDEVAFRDHILLWKYKRPKLTEPDPLTDGTAVIAGEGNHFAYAHNVWLRRKLAFVITSNFLCIIRQLRLNANLIRLDIYRSVFIPVLRGYVFFGIDLSVIHKGDNIALFDAVAARFLTRAGVGNEIELEKIERRSFANVACNTHLLLVHDLRVLFEFFCIVFHDEAPFIFSVRKGAPYDVFWGDFSCMCSCKQARKKV